MSPLDAFCATLKSDRPDGLFTTMVVDENGIGLGVCYSNLESLREAVKTRRGVYWSRTRGLWRKGETSGATQELLRIDADCDQDTLRFVVRQQGTGFCHENTWTCFGEDWGIGRLCRTLESRKANAPPGSYTKRLFEVRTAKTPSRGRLRISALCPGLGAPEEQAARGGAGAGRRQDQAGDHG